jgi:hypothetical protein
VADAAHASRLMWFREGEAPAERATALGSAGGSPSQDRAKSFSRRPGQAEPEPVKSFRPRTLRFIVVRQLLVSVVLRIET